MYKIAVIGGGDTVTGFKALGLDVFPVSNSEEASRTLRELAKSSSNYAIIYMEETFAADLSAEIDRYKDRITPAVILIPGRDGPLGIGQRALQDAVIRAIGTDI